MSVDSDEIHAEGLNNNYKSCTEIGYVIIMAAVFHIVNDEDAP